MKLKPINLRSFFFSKQIPTPPLFSFSSYKCFTNHTRKPSHFFDDVVPGTSAVYNHALKFQRPATIKWKPHLDNTTTFIGSVTRELKRVNTTPGNFGVYTTLRVPSSNKPNSSSIWVLLKMWGNVGEFADEHLKPNHFICVSGCLVSFTKADDNGNFRLCYELNVKELNFVSQRLWSDDHGKEHSLHVTKASNQNNGNRLHLWQVFFANPNEWWDQRKCKTNPKQPDFKHRDTGEALWLSKHDPPWVTKQLELHDSKIAEGGFLGRRPRVASWVYDE